MSKKDMLAMFITKQFRIDNNSSNGLNQNSSCTYSNQGDCSSCCSKELVLTR